eukprot:CAMPEP_0167809206 /NCGR_PEP_ID=MMETSP0111_2-20121227/23657_1 /TAXON_ID=91324 /ORGANISM="Lotharella globosa, Strain CCCM811" /LENGTH=137 /DNA_ID=CAMNT_0007707549 /DNA_START=606 /DNA_END=1015 /DNA_ORIENTATION=+
MPFSGRMHIPIPEDCRRFFVSGFATAPLLCTSLSDCRTVGVTYLIAEPTPLLEILMKRALPFAASDSSSWPKAEAVCWMSRSRSHCAAFSDLTPNSLGSLFSVSPALELLPEWGCVFVFGTSKDGWHDDEDEEDADA